MKRNGSWALAVAIGSLATLLLVGCGPSDPGQRVFEKKCAGCHGKDGRGQTKFARGRPFANLTDGKWKHGGDRASIRKLVSDGDPTSPMPPFHDRLSTPELDAAVDYVLKLAERGPGGPKSPS